MWSGGVYLDHNWRYYANLGGAVEGINQLYDGADFTPGTAREDQHFTGRTFGSFHPGGCNMAFADGSVQFMLTTLNVNIHRSLATIADGLPTGDGGF
jgi:prepilin-type processing-associated H-X9-DG protein